MENQYGDADADFPGFWPGFKPGYQSYIDSLGSRREAPSSLILAAGERAVMQMVHACGAVLGPVYHLADPDHTAIRAAVARLEPSGPLLAMTGDRILLTTAGGHPGCPLCGVFGPHGAAGWRSGACPVLAGPAPAPADRLTVPVLQALHVLIDEICRMSGQAGADLPLGYSIALPAGRHDASKHAPLAGVCVHRGHP